MGITTVSLSDEPLHTLERTTREEDLTERQLVPRALTRYFDAEPDETDSITRKQEQLEAEGDPSRKTAAKENRS